MQHHLEFNGTTRTLGPGVLTIGAGREAGWRIETRGLERIHAMITVERDGRVILNRGDEVAWVELNGHPLATSSAEIRPGDEVRLGEAVFRLVAGVPHGAEEDRAGFLRDVKRDRWYRLGESTAIGRDLSCAILILDPDISRTHAEVVRGVNGYEVHPRRGVTLVNTRRATEPTPLTEGDEVTVGQTTMRFTQSPPPRGAAAPARLSSQLREVAGMQTTFMSPLAVREGMRKRQQRRVGLIVGGVFGVMLLVALIASSLTSRGRPTRATTRATSAGGLADTTAFAPATLPAAVPAPAADSAVPAPDPRLPDSVPPLEASPAAEEPITAGGTRRRRP